MKYRHFPFVMTKNSVRRSKIYQESGIHIPDLQNSDRKKHGVDWIFANISRCFMTLNQRLEASGDRGWGGKCCCRATWFTITLPKFGNMAESNGDTIHLLWKPSAQQTCDWLWIQLQGSSFVCCPVSMWSPPFCPAVQKEQREFTRWYKIGKAQAAHWWIRQNAVQMLWSCSQAADLSLGAAV